MVLLFLVGFYVVFYGVDGVGCMFGHVWYIDFFSLIGVLYGEPRGLMGSSG